MSNLQIFRSAVDQFLKSQYINSSQQWQSMLNHLCDVKIFSPQQIKVLNQNVEKRTFPIKTKQFEEIIMRQFGDESTKNLIKDIDQIQKQIRQTKGVLAVWKEKGLSKNQIRALQILFARGNSKMKQICNMLEEKKQLLESISQPQVQLIKAMDQWSIVQKVKQTYKNYQQFQQINGKAIQNLYNQLRVRQVHFRTKKAAKISQSSIHSVIGFNSKTDEQVEVTKIPKKMSEFQIVNTALVTFNAQHDLMLSPYFVRFLGYNTSTDQNYYYYFRQYIQAKNLQYLLKSSSVQMEQSFPIFKFWVGEIFRALRDIYYQCSYEPILPIKIKDIQVAEHGLRQQVSKIEQFLSIQSNDNLQPQLLQNVGQLILELLNIDATQIQTKLKNIQNQTLLYTLLKAKANYKKYQQKIVPYFINFNNAQTHPLFQAIQQTQGMEIIDNFTILFSDIQ